MIKKLLIIASFLGIVSFSNAQAYNGEGDQKVQIGVNAFGYGTGITGSYDYGILDWLSVGAGGNFYWSDDDDNFFIYGRVNFHLDDLLDLPYNMDLYPTVRIGGRNEGFGIGAGLGYRYFFTDKIGAFAELGSYGSLGVSINL